MTNNQKLREIIEKYDLTRPQVAEFLRVSIKAVDNWLSPLTSKSYRKMSNGYLDLLNLKIKKP